MNWHNWEPVRAPLAKGDAIHWKCRYCGMRVKSQKRPEGQGPKITVYRYFAPIETVIISCEEFLVNQVMEL
jgi:hypothetical protein